MLFLQYLHLTVKTNPDEVCECIFPLFYPYYVLFLGVKISVHKIIAVVKQVGSFISLEVWFPLPLTTSRFQRSPVLLYFGLYCWAEKSDIYFLMSQFTVIFSNVFGSIFSSVLKAERLMQKWMEDVKILLKKILGLFYLL